MSLVLNCTAARSRDTAVLIKNNAIDIFYEIELEVYSESPKQNLSGSITHFLIFSIVFILLLTINSVCDPFQTYY